MLLCPVNKIFRPQETFSQRVQSIRNRVGSEKSGQPMEAGTRESPVTKEQRHWLCARLNAASFAICYHFRMFGRSNKLFIHSHIKTWKRVVLLSLSPFDVLTSLGLPSLRAQNWSSGQNRTNWSTVDQTVKFAFLITPAHTRTPTFSAQTRIAKHICGRWRNDREMVFSVRENQTKKWNLILFCVLNWANSFFTEINGLSFKGKHLPAKNIRQQNRATHFLGFSFGRRNDPKNLKQSFFGATISGPLWITNFFDDQNLHQFFEILIIIGGISVCVCVCVCVCECVRVCCHSSVANRTKLKFEC